MASDLSLPPSFVDAFVSRLGVSPLEPRDFAHDRAMGPVHVIYGGAQLFDAGSADKLRDRAITAMETWGADDATFARTVGVVDDVDLARAVAARVRDKLARRAVEAICIDFEDGYGPRPDAEEDADAVRTARELAKLPADGPLVGLRIKALTGPTARRAVRTLDLFVTALAHATNGRLRAGFTVTLPKVVREEEVGALADLLDHLESSLGLPRVGVELMVESPRALVDPNGGVAIPALVRAGRERTVAMHLGAYDLTAELGVTAADQRLDHPYCDLARLLLQLTLTGSSIAVSDGATTTLPVAPKNSSVEESSAAIQRAWSLHAANVRRAIDVGIWRGWDLHPAQLPARYGALFAHFLSRRSEIVSRLRNFVTRATQATRVGQAFDDAATGQGLVSFFRRGLACGALTADDLVATTLTNDDLSRPFAEIVAQRIGRVS